LSKTGKWFLPGGFGYRDVKNKLEVTPDTLFAIGSCTKAFTATVLGMLVEEGKLEWNKPVRNYLPALKLYDPVVSEQITPLDLVTHRSGLPRHDLVWYGSSATREEIFKRLQFLEFSKGFRATFQYNNLMFMTAGYMAGKIAGMSWEELVQKKIFNPLGMKTSNFSVIDMQKSKDFSFPYSKREDKVTGIPFRNIDAIGPAGSINSSVNEMAQWLLLNLNKGKVGDKQVILESTLSNLHTPRMVTTRLSKDKEFLYSSYALGWGVSSYRGHPVVTHGGGIDGFISEVSMLPRANAGIIVLTNSDKGGDSFCPVIVYNVYDRILRLPRIPWSKRYKEQAEKAKKDAEKGKKKQDDVRKPNTKPSHNLEDYTGQYENPGYGVFTIGKDGEKLTAAFNGFQFKCEHYHYDIFTLFSKDFSSRKFKATFFTDVKGNISRFSILLQPWVKDIEFIRKPEKKGKEFLEQFLGKYELQGAKVTISFKDENTLRVTTPGRPTLELVPYKDMEFTLKKFKDFSFKFITDASGKVTGFEFHRAAGVFIAKKIK
jgi:CubicO group peptidase (beta-lactamase class C family)